MRKFLSRALKVAGVAFIILVLAYSAVAVVLYSSMGRFPLKDTPPPPRRINNLVWPTVGFPAVTRPGYSVVVEFDPGNGVQDAGRENPAGWKASMKASRAGLSSLTYRLKALKAWLAFSERWPRGTRHGSPRKVWRVEFQVPPETVPELYDLTVEAVKGEGWTPDTQPHSVSVTDKANNDFRFVTLADIHVHRRDISWLFQEQTDKGISRDGTPVYFEEAIEQVNLIRPDFVILLGDFVRAQHSPGDYQLEFEEFFKTMLRFEVPVFTVPGNHDLYVNEVNGAKVWEETFGPLRYSFDMANCHFTAVNTSDWPFQDRIVMEKFGLFVYPRKWQGQVSRASNERDPETFKGQLAWIRDDLEAHAESRLRVVLMHHDPYTPDGEGRAWENERFAGAFTMGGGGKGRRALLELFSRCRVDSVFSGHLHCDDVGRERWSAGGGETVFANQTCVYFDEGGVQEKYPGYRLVEIEGAAVTSFAYLDREHSIPLYDGSVLDGETNVDRLSLPAISAEYAEPEADREAAGAAWTVRSYLAQPMELRGLVTGVDSPDGGFVARGGEIYRVVPIPGTGRSLVYLSARLGAGVPGRSASDTGKPFEREVSVRPAEAEVEAAARALTP
jgi:predicted MPP superfamily phosphohydrolase